MDSTLQKRVIDSSTWVEELIDESVIVQILVAKDFSLTLRYLLIYYQFFLQHFSEEKGLNLIDFIHYCPMSFSVENRVLLSPYYFHPLMPSIFCICSPTEMNDPCSCIILLRTL